MLSVDDALARILDHVRVNPVVERPLLEALDHVLAQPIDAPFAVPPWDNSSMDGFAVRSADTDGARRDTPKQLPVIGQSVAGRLPEVAVEPLTAVRIMTGAPLPTGADAVVPFENTDRGPTRGADHLPATVAVYSAVRPRQNVRPRGEDLAPGQRVLEAGRLLGPPELGLLAAIGLATVPVVRRPRVAILSTGDELAEPGSALAPGQIYDANTYSLAAAIRQAGAEPLVLGQVRDEPEALQARLLEATAADLVLTTAGVSMGDYDYVREVLSELGDLDFWRIQMRPGRPLVFGHLRTAGEPVPLVGLPGNPVSALLTFLILVRPAILKMRGLPPKGLPTIEAVLEERVTNDDGRRTFARVTLRRDGETWYARLTGPQGSSLLTSVAAADGLAIIPEEVAALASGERAAVLLIREPARDLQPAMIAAL